MASEAGARRWPKILAAVVFVVAVLGGAGAYTVYRMLYVEPIDADTDTAVARFTQVLNGDASLEQEALRSLAGAIERDSSDARAWLWFGLANMYLFIENRELAYAIRTSRSLAKSVALDPSYKSAEGWRAFFDFMASQQDGVTEAPAETEDLLAAGRADPGFSSFLVALGLARMPLESGLPQKALAPLVAVGDCGDGTTYTCRTSSLHPHAPEGYHATLGDLRIRLGDVEGGRASYEKALTMPGADTWPYRQAFIEWMAGAEDRAAKLTNDSPDDDPDIFFANGKRACLSCHEHERPSSAVVN